MIVEYGFIDNKNDAEKLRNNYKDYAEAVIKAVMDYKGLKYTKPNNMANSSSLKNDTYIVKNGDTLWTIAKNNGLTVDELKKINNLQSNLLTIGEELKLSSNANDIKDYIVKNGDTLYSIAQKYNLTVQKLKDMNNLNSDTIYVGQKLKLSDKVYTVKSGDNLYDIAMKYNTSIKKIMELNNLSTSVLQMGQKLLIP